MSAPCTRGTRDRRGPRPRHSRPSAVAVLGTRALGDHGPEGPRGPGTMAPGHLGPRVLEDPRPGEPQTVGTGIPRFHGIAEPGRGGTPVRRPCGTPACRHLAPAGPGIVGARAPRHSRPSAVAVLGTRALGDHGPEGPRGPGTMAPGHLGPRGPRAGRTGVPTSRGAPVPGDPGTQAPRAPCRSCKPPHGSTRGLFSRLEVPRWLNQSLSPLVQSRSAYKTCSGPCGPDVLELPCGMSRPRSFSGSEVEVPQRETITAGSGSAQVPRDHRCLSQP